MRFAPWHTQPSTDQAMLLRGTLMRWARSKLEALVKTQRSDVNAADDFSTRCHDSRSRTIEEAIPERSILYSIGASCHWRGCLQSLCKWKEQPVACCNLGTGKSQVLHGVHEEVEATMKVLNKTALKTAGAIKQGRSHA